VKENFRWKTVVGPLRDFCRESHFAADKGKYLTEVERISLAKDGFLEQVIKDKDRFYQAIVADRDATIQRYRNTLPFRVFGFIKRILGR
jgi:hypothetical protein